MTTTMQVDDARTAAGRRSEGRRGGASTRASMRASMRAYVVREPFGVDALAAVEWPIPEPGPGQVLVRMRAVALNYRDRGGFSSPACSWRRWSTCTSR
jgi:hypothetical protein